MLLWWSLLHGCSVLDREPPLLDARIAPGPHRERVEVSVTVSDPSGARAWVVMGGRTVEVVDGSAVLSVTDHATGPVDVVVHAEDASPWHHRAMQTLTTLVDPVAPELQLREASVGVGRTAALWVGADEPLVEPTVTIFDEERPLYEVDGRYRALIGVGLRTVPGSVPYTVAARDAAGNEVTARGTLEVEPVDYPVRGSIRLTRAQVAARRDEEAKATMRAERDGAYALQRHEQRWAGTFHPPLDGRQTSPFGAYRRYSDGDRSYHTGLDLTNRRGTPVVAAADGEVVIARAQAIHGNAVILHHGQGVTSSYSHLREMAVQEGEQVNAGQQLGIMGSTGQSTGPHLHFGVVVSGRAVDPQQWLTSDPSAPPEGWPEAP